MPALRSASSLRIQDRRHIKIRTERRRGILKYIPGHHPPRLPKIGLIDLRMVAVRPHADEITEAAVDELGAFLRTIIHLGAIRIQQRVTVPAKRTDLIEPVRNVL